MRRCLLTLALIATCLLSATAWGDVRLPKIFTDRAVLQQEAPIVIWGWADKGEGVLVALAGKTAETKADTDGKWRVSLPAMKADGKAHTLTVKGSNTIQLKDVLIGEVWLASGQSNMTRGLRYVKARAQAEKMNFPNLRLFAVKTSQIPQKDDLLGGFGWAPATHESMKTIFVHPRVGTYEFSEVTYCFGKALHENLKVPVGVITTAWGGTTAKQWTPLDKPEEHFDFKSLKPQRGPGSFYQANMHGLVPFAIRGAIWYQGENDGRNRNYAADMKRLIESWRARWRRKDMPFYMVQIAQTTYAGGMLGVWEAQSQVMRTVPNTGLAPSNDLWDKVRIDKVAGGPIAGGGNPHPPNKHRAAARLADIALAKTYGSLKREVFGPMYASHEVKGGKIIVKFKHAGNGLKTDDGKAPNWFEISSGAKRAYVKAVAKIVGKDTVEVSSPDVAKPASVRFAWHALARHNLYNSEKLPAISFRTNAAPK
ncbi:MAG: sialate O-acetylesterase [Phycisphaerae bacterium]|jgi:sialate O-acetylesterase|nr:sialate O-acetylesterase [Phycisphaerae bacterium]